MEADSEVLGTPLGALAPRFLAMPSQRPFRGEVKSAVCVACSNSGFLGLARIRRILGTCLIRGLFPRYEVSDTGSAGKVMDLMTRFVRLRERYCVVFETEMVDEKDWGMVSEVCETSNLWSVGFKLTKRGLSICGGDSDDEAVTHTSMATDDCQSVDLGDDNSGLCNAVLRV